MRSVFVTVCRSLAWTAGIVLAVLFALAQDALAAPADRPETPGPLVLQATVPRFDLADKVAVLEDCSGSLTIDDVARDEWGNRFRRPTSPTLNFGYTNCNYWMRLDLVCGPEPCDDWLLVLKSPRPEHVDLYRDGVVARSGSSVALSRRPMRLRLPTFPLGHLSAGTNRLTLRLQSSDTSSYPLSLIRRGAFIEDTSREHLLLGLYFGIMLLTALCSAVVFLSLRDTAYLLFAEFITCYCLYQAAVHGLDIATFWPEHPLWQRPVLLWSCSLTVVSGAAFSAHFLMLRKYAPALRYPVYGVLASGLVMMGLTTLGAFTTAGVLGSFLGPAAVITFAVAAVIAMRRGCPHAKYFLLAGTLQFVGVVLNGLRNLAVLPDLFITMYGAQLGSVLFVVLVSFALMARFERLRREKEHAQEQFFQSQRAATDAKRVTAELRLQALQAKINPHFLFNTLNTIAGLIAEAPERAQGVVIRLSRLFRYILTATSKDRVLLAEELSIVRSYLEVEQERFGERMRFDIQIEGDIEGLTLPGLTLQPLVENAVKHGLRPKIEGGQVLVRAWAEDSSLHLTITDDGVGMDPSLDTEGHGLHSVRERLRLAFGAASSSLTVTSPPGTRIDIRIPAQR